MREIINKQQAAILQVLDNTVDAKHADLTEKTGIPYETYRVSMGDLRDRDMVHATKAGSRHVMRLSITMAGTRALRDYIDHQLKMQINPGMAQPSRINLFELPVYAVPKQAYCRNDGNRHIRSLGAFA